MVAEELKTGLQPSVDVIKNARKLFRTAEAKEHQMPARDEDSLDIMELQYFLGATKVLNPTLNFEQGLYCAN